MPDTSNGNTASVWHPGFLVRDRKKMMAYDSQTIARYFDNYGKKEWSRLILTPVDEVNFHIHASYLWKYLKNGDRILEIGAGPGRFTQLMAEIGARIIVVDISPKQLELNRENAGQLGFEQAVEAWVEADICALNPFFSETFDAVVVYGGPLSYVLDQRDKALQECIRVLQPGGYLLLSVMSLWGSAHRNLDGVLQLNPVDNKRIIESGDLTAQTFPGRQSNFMHMFRAGELMSWLEDYGLDLQSISSSGCLSIGWEKVLTTIRQDEKLWNELLRIEVEASSEPGALDMGTHLIAVANKPIQFR